MVISRLPLRLEKLLAVNTDAISLADPEMPDTASAWIVPVVTELILDKLLASAEPARTVIV